MTSCNTWNFQLRKALKQQPRTCFLILITDVGGRGEGPGRGARFMFIGTNPKHDRQNKLKGAGRS